MRKVKKLAVLLFILGSLAGCAGKTTDTDPAEHEAVEEMDGSREEAPALTDEPESRLEKYDFKSCVGSRVGDLPFKDELTKGKARVDKYNYDSADVDKDGHPYLFRDVTLGEGDSIDLKKSFIYPRGLDSVNYGEVCFIIENEGMDVCCFEDAVVAGYSCPLDKMEKIDITGSDWILKSKSYLRVVDSFTVEKVTPDEYYYGMAFDIVASNWLKQIKENYTYRTDTGYFVDHSCTELTEPAEFGLLLDTVILHPVEKEDLFKYSFSTHEAGAGTHDDYKKREDTGVLNYMSFRRKKTDTLNGFTIGNLYCEECWQPEDIILEYAGVEGYGCELAYTFGSFNFYSMITPEEEDYAMYGILYDTLTGLHYTIEISKETGLGEEECRTYLQEFTSFLSTHIRKKAE